MKTPTFINDKLTKLINDLALTIETANTASDIGIMRNRNYRNLKISEPPIGNELLEKLDRLQKSIRNVKANVKFELTRKTK